MEEVFLFLASVFLFTFLIGKLLEKIKVPWIFAALLGGVILAIKNPFSQVTSSLSFKFLAQLGMYFLLFVIGFELDLNKIKKQSGFIFRSTFFIISFEAIFGTLLVHFVLNYPWFISSIVSLSFATVGEAILIPILDEFKIINTNLGESIIGIGTLDDIIEISLLIVVSVMIGSKINVFSKIADTFILLGILIFLSFILIRLKKKIKKLNFISVETLFLFVLFVFFLFLGIGQFVDIVPISALIAGLAIKSSIPKEKISEVRKIIKITCYSFLAPLFFVWVGISLNMSYLLSYPLIIVLVVVVTSSAKILGSLIVGKKKFGIKKSVLLGIGLSVRFSTSIIIIKILFENNLIGIDLYSIIVASSIVFKFIIPVLFSNLLVKWKIARNKY